MSYTVNCSIVFPDVPLLERAAAAKAAGFDAVEFWWPFPTSTPDQDDVDAFVNSILNAGVQLTGLNFDAGDMPGGDRGYVSWPERSDDFRANLDVVTRIAERTGTRAFNALYGNRVDDGSATPEEQDELGTENLRRAAEAVARIDGIVLLEPSSGAPRYPLISADDALAVIERVGAPNIKLLADFYHLATNDQDVAAVVEAHAPEFGHIQIADSNGRGEPGTGDLPLFDWIARSRELGYTGPIGLEYKPTRPDTFSWVATAPVS